ncbi:50S ribosomal protein L29 [Candidatus Altiarchaeales archaeon WOR_SM1_SCG]|nr:50S ribosomal protein L29 [Candidatus Altiarchaeales archaeon WOR_SM1_SCG]
MSILRASEIREMDNEEINEHLKELQSDLMKIRGVIESGGVPEDLGKTREIRKTIARILTIKRERKT